MFSIFKTKSQPEVLIDHVDDFNNFFDEEQKKAIMVSLFAIANADDEFHDKERAFFRETAGILNYELGEEIVIAEMLSMDQRKAIKVIKGFNDKQKEWYLITVLGMVHADGKAVDEELQKVLKILKKAGMSRAQIASVKERFDLFKGLA